MKRKYRSKVVEVQYLFDEIIPADATVAEMKKHHAVLSNAIANLSAEVDRLFEMQREIHLAYKRQ